MSSAPSLRPLGFLKHALCQSRLQRRQTRSLTTETFAYKPPPGLPPGMNAPVQKASKDRLSTIQVPRPKAHIKKTCPVPLKPFIEGELALLDPSGSRTRLIAKTNPDAIKVGDVAMVRFKTGDPFAGVVLNIRRRGTDSSILLRNQLTRVGTELWVKLYSPTVSGIEIVQKSQKKMRRARAYYFRKPKHDRGSLDKLVDSYVQQTRMLGRGNAGGNKDKRMVRGQPK